MAERDRERLGGVGLFGGVLLHDVPVHGAVLQDTQARHRLPHAHFAHHDGLATRDVAKDAREVEHHAELLHRDERVTLERLLVDHRQVVHPEGDVGEVAEEADSHAAPAYVGVHGLRDLRADARSDAVAEEVREYREEDDDDADCYGYSDYELAMRAHGACVESGHESLCGDDGAAVPSGTTPSNGSMS